MIRCRALPRLLLLLNVFAAVAQAQTKRDELVYLDPAQPVETRVDDLLGRMTLEEKIAQMDLWEFGDAEKPVGKEMIEVVEHVKRRCEDCRQSLANKDPIL